MSANDEELSTEDSNEQNLKQQSTVTAITEQPIDHNVVSSNDEASKTNIENEIPQENFEASAEKNVAEENSDDDSVSENEVNATKVTAVADKRETNDADLKTKQSSSVGDIDALKKPKVSAESNEKASEQAEHITYNEDGTAIYTDPNTRHKYRWCEKTNSWLALETTLTQEQSENPYENEHYKWCTETQRWIPKETQVTETEFYKWDVEKNEWVQKPQKAPTATDTESAAKSTNITEEKVYSIDENGQRVYTDRDGAVFFYDEEKNAWFPKIDDDFMARYQMNYGFIDNVSAGAEEKRQKEAAEAQRKAEELERMAEEARSAMENAQNANNNTTSGKRKIQEPPKWFDIDPEHNTKVYVSNLPLDITLDEFAELMGKCGMIMRDQQTQKFKLKLYTESDGQIKGDGLCDYIKVESVNLALKILDEYVYRGNKIHVQRAQFQMRGEYNPALKPKRKKKDKEKLNKLKERLFDWRPEKMRGERSKNEKIVIIKNLFTPEQFEKNIQLILDYQNDLREECSKCGIVRKVIIYDLHPEGVAQINMASPEEADLVIQMMQGRFFGKRQLSAEHWDGKTKYKIGESEKEAQERLTNWDDFLETGDEEKAKEKALKAEECLEAEETVREEKTTTTSAAACEAE